MSENSLRWQKMAPAPVPHLDGVAIQIRNLLFIFAGYSTIDYWQYLGREIRHTVRDGAFAFGTSRYIYVVIGQYGQQSFVGDWGIVMAGNHSWWRYWTA